MGEGMKLTLAEPKYFKDSISIISELVNEACFKVTKDSIELIAMDPANVAMVIFKLLSSAFTEYNVTNNVEIAINLSNLKQILRRAKPNDILSLEIDNNQLKITLKSNATRTFRIPIIEIDEKEQKVPNLEFSGVVHMPSIVFNDAIEDVDIVGESVLFEITGKNLNIIAEGDMNKAKIEIKDSETVKINASQDGVRSKYSIEYLKKMMAGSKLADEVSILFSKDYPLKLEYKCVDRLMLSFILAPRVDND